MAKTGGGNFVAPRFLWVKDVSLQQSSFRRAFLKYLRRMPWGDIDAVVQLRLALLLLGLLLFVGTVGYILLEGMQWLDALYMTVITLTTIGYGEVEPLTPIGRVFTLFVIISGVGLTGYAIQNAVQVMAGDRIWRTLGERDVKNRLASIQDHYIICGYGRMGQEITRELKRRNVPVVVIDTNLTIEDTLLENHIPFVIGDASRDETLQAAAVERARGLFSVVSSDAGNVLIVLSAKGLNPTLKIVARAALPEMESKLYRAGASIVSSPYVFGGQRMAVAMVRPAVYDFLNAVVYGEGTDNEMGQLTIREDSPFVGRALRDSQLRNRFGAIVLAIVRPTHEVIVSPAAETVLNTGDTLILVAPIEILHQLRAEQ
jgi:voltage-gated potassium channel